MFEAQVDTIITDRLTAALAKAQVGGETGPETNGGASSRVMNND